ncbi:MAG: hypothetical protein RL220_995, partial [Bacteroidota bacterium]
MRHFLLSLLCLLYVSVLQAQNYNGSTGQVCSAYYSQQGEFANAPYVAQNVTITIQWLYCGPWSGSNNGHIYVDILQNSGWVELFDLSDYGNGCSWVTDTWSIPAAMWNESIDVNGGSVVIQCYISDSCPGGVGCSYYNDPCYIATVNFDYEPLETPVAQAVPSVNTSCESQSISITDSSSGTSLEYSWNFGSGAVPATSNSPGNQVVQYTTPGVKTITLTVSNLLGSSVSQFDILVNPSPELSTSDDISACSNEFPLTIEAFGTGEIQWSNNLGTNASVEINPPSSTTYYVDITNEFECSSSDSVVVVVLETPSVSAGDDLEICNGETITLNGNGEGDVYWEEYPDSGLELNFTPSQTSTFHITAVAMNGCSNADSVLVVVNDLPVAYAGEDQEICNGESTQITAEGGIAYAWDNDLGEGQMHEVNPEQTTVYTVTVTSENGCEDEDSISVTVYETPIAEISEDVSVCFGNSTTISASGGTEYTWDQGLGEGAEHEVSPEESTTYTVVVSNDDGCSDTGSIFVEVFPAVDVSLTGLSENPYCHNDENAYNMLGIPSGGTYSGLGVVNNQFFPSQAGIGPVEITYAYTDENGCEYSVSDIVVVEICISVEEFLSNFQFYPNPAGDVLNIEFGMTLEGPVE